MYDAIAREKYFLIYMVFYVLVYIMLELEKKLTLYCDLNDIANPERYYELTHKIENIVDDKQIATLCAYNTDSFLVQWLWDIAHHTIDDETFFQIWDISVHRTMKEERPYLDALSYIKNNIEKNTLYVIDQAAYIAYTHVHQDIDEILESINNHNSIMIVIPQ